MVGEHVAHDERDVHELGPLDARHRVEVDAELIGVAEVFQYFLVPLVINNGTGDPGGATLFYNLYLYKNFFTFQNMAYGATLAWFLFVIILAATLALFWSARRWVFYAGER